MEDLQEIRIIPIGEIFSDEHFNCRGRIVPIDVQDLIGSIPKVGLLQPLVVQPYDVIPGKKYRIVCGHRRYAAMEKLGKSSIPCVVKSNLNEFDARTLNLVENLKRSNLNILQEAKALEPYKLAKWKDDYIASEVGMSRGWVQVRTMLLTLPDDVQQVAAAGILKQDHIKQLYTLKDDKDKLYAAVRLIKDRADSGDKKALQLIKKDQKPFRKEERTAAEIFEMQDVIRNVIGNSFVTVAMGWCAGIVNDYEMHREIRETAILMGRTYEVPSSVKP